MLEVHISKHSLFRLKITVGCLTLNISPSIHVETLKITVGCLVCGVGGVCVVLLWWCVCVVCGEAWHTLSLSCSLSFLFSFPFAFPFFFPLLSLSFSLLFLFLFSCSFSYSCSCSCSFSFSSLSLSLFSSRHQTLWKEPIKPTRRPTSRHLNVIWRRASAQQSVLSLLLLSSLLPSLPPLLKKKKRGLCITGIFPARRFIFLQF